MLRNLQKYAILLASNSPRRKELLAGLEVSYTVTALPDIDESFPDGLSKEEIPQYIARKKAEAYRHQMAENTLLITADTIVWCDGLVLGKPADKEEAYAMIRTLSGRTHQVVTGVCIQSKERMRSFASVADVTFAVLTEEEIKHYVDVYHPMDKAGAYGIQEWIGYIGVTAIKGCYYNVMGLPVQQLYTELKTF